MTPPTPGPRAADALRDGLARILTDAGLDPHHEDEALLDALHEYATTQGAAGEPNAMSDARDHVRALLCLLDEEESGARDDPDYDEASRTYLITEARRFLGA